MLLPLLCLVFCLGATTWVLLDANGYIITPLEHMGDLTQWITVWGGYLGLVTVMTVVAGRYTRRDWQMQMNGCLHIFAAILFVACLQSGQLIATKALYWIDYHWGLELWFVWEFILMAPFFLAQLVVIRRPATDTFRRGWGPALRFQTMLMLPYLVIRPLVDIPGSGLIDPQTLKFFEHGAWHFPLACLLIFFMIAILPSFAGFVMKTKPLPAGDLREQLTAQASSQGVTVRRLKLWEAGDGLVNAAVVGTIPVFRFMVITQGMIQQFTPSEIGAVFWHELGHVIKRHMWIYFLFYNVVIGASLMLPAITGVELSQITQAFVMLAFWGVGFSWISRQLEKQADLFALKKVGSLYIDVLRKLSSISGVPYRFKSLSHGSIKQRVDFLNGLYDKPADENRFQKRVRSVVLILCLLFLLEWVFWGLAYLV